MTQSPELDQLQDQVREVRRQRLAAQRRAETLPAVTYALTVAERDEAAVTSVELRAERDRVQRLQDRVLGDWNETLAKINSARVVLEGERIEAPDLVVELDELEARVGRQRADVAQHLAVLGVHLPGLGQ